MSEIPRIEDIHPNPHTVKKARFWKRVSQWFTMALVTVTVLLVVGVLVETLVINHSIQQQITENTKSRNDQLSQIRNSLNTLHKQSDASRKAYNDYMTCVITQTRTSPDISVCNNLKPE